MELWLSQAFGTVLAIRISSEFGHARTVPVAAHLVSELEKLGSLTGPSQLVDTNRWAELTVWGPSEPTEL